MLAILANLSPYFGSLLILCLNFIMHSKTEQSKVMREVRALAKLENHQHVVRYNTSWKERAPPDWKTRNYWAELRESSAM